MPPFFRRRERQVGHLFEEFVSPDGDGSGAPGEVCEPRCGERVEVAPFDAIGLPTGVSQLSMVSDLSDVRKIWQLWDTVGPPPREPAASPPLPPPPVPPRQPPPAPPVR